MHSDYYGFIRALALVIFLLLIFSLCAVRAQPAEIRMEEPEPKPTERSKILLAGLEDEPSFQNTSSTEPTMATEPPTEPPTEPIPTETWESLGIYELTAYCSCSACCGSYGQNRPTDQNGNPIVYTASGAIAKAGTTIAVDPRVIPYGSEVQIFGHTYIAQDTGGAIVSRRIDIYFDDHQEALVFGRQRTEIFIKTPSA